MGGDGSPAAASESEEERRIQMASLRTWREAGNGPLSSDHRQQAVKVYSFFYMRLVCFFRRDKTLFFHLLKIYIFVGQLCPLRVGTTLETAPLSIERGFRPSNHNVESQ